MASYQTKIGNDSTLIAPRHILHEGAKTGQPLSALIPLCSVRARYDTYKDIPRYILFSVGPLSRTTGEGHCKRARPTYTNH